MPHRSGARRELGLWSFSFSFSTAPKGTGCIPTSGPLHTCKVTVPGSVDTAEWMTSLPSLTREGCKEDADRGSTDLKPHCALLPRFSHVGTGPDSSGSPSAAPYMCHPWEQAGQELRAPLESREAHTLQRSVGRGTESTPPHTFHVPGSLLPAGPTALSGTLSPSARWPCPSPSATRGARV